MLGARAGYRLKGRVVVIVRGGTGGVSPRCGTAELLARYQARREAALRHLYGERWAEVCNERTMLKDDDYGLEDR